MNVRVVCALSLAVSLLPSCGPEGGSGLGGAGGEGCEPYTEPLPDPRADIAGLVAAYRPADVNDFVLDVLERRYPTGRLVVAGALERFDCIAPFLSAGKDTAQAVIFGLQTVVHECGHMYDGAQGGGGDNAYVLTEALTLQCSAGDSVGRGGRTFARSRIRDDAFAAAKPDDFYRLTYLDGDPDDAIFDGGDQGFNMLLEEAVQYVNSLATTYAFNGELRSGGATSSRDGILTFLWYLERYLHMARLQYPPVYEHLLSGDGGCWRGAVLDVWDRAHLYLEATQDMTFLGLDDEKLQDLIETPELLDEIERLRDAEGCRAR